MPIRETGLQRHDLPSEEKLREKLKAELILQHDGWRPLIDRAESHGYFRGQIDFLLDV